MRCGPRFAVDGRWLAVRVHISVVGFGRKSNDLRLMLTRAKATIIYNNLQRGETREVAGIVLIILSAGQVKKKTTTLLRISHYQIYSVMCQHKKARRITAP